LAVDRHSKAWRRRRQNATMTSIIDVTAIASHGQKFIVSLDTEDLAEHEPLKESQ
jgi:hypothetical protein